MRRRTFHACALAALGLALTQVGCAQSDTILLVVISGPRTETFLPHQFRATITAGLDAKVFAVPEQPSPSALILPQSFSVALDRSHTGPVTVSIVALGESTAEVGSGTTTQQHIVIGGQTVIAVALTEKVEPTDEPDGGSPDPEPSPDAGLPVSDARDGALGQDGAGDRMGLDTGTD